MTNKGKDSMSQTAVYVLSGAFATAYSFLVYFRFDDHLTIIFKSTYNLLIFRLIKFVFVKNL